MTTAGRPTFDTARGKDRGLAKLSQIVSSRDLPGHLTLKERAPKEETFKDEKILKAELEERERMIIKSQKKLSLREMAQIDEDEDFGSDDFSYSDFDDDDDEDEDDDQEELLAELSKIKEERREKAAKESSKELATPSFSIKRRWDDDVPFKNCSRSEPEAKKKSFSDNLFS